MRGVGERVHLRRAVNGYEEDVGGWVGEDVGGGRWGLGLEGGGHLGCTLWPLGVGMDLDCSSGGLCSSRVDVVCSPNAPDIASRQSSKMVWKGQS